MAAYFLTDEAFGVVAGSGKRTFAFLLGAELSLFAMWNLATLGGAIAGSAIRTLPARHRPRLPARVPRIARSARAHAR